MYLIFITIFCLVIVIWLFKRDRQYRQKNIEDVVSNDLKKDLNLPTKDDLFPSELKKRTDKESPSKEILKGMNE